VLITFGGLVNTASPKTGSIKRSEILLMTDESRKDERRNRFDRKKKKIKNSDKTRAKHFLAEPFKRTPNIKRRALDYEY
jgi:hypothetical protein